MLTFNVILFSVIGLVVFALALVMIALRRVVPTNEVHIVQSSKKTTSFGKDTTNGNTYYEWPSWVPFIGVNKMVLPVSVFDLDLNDYNAYDRDRLPFRVHILAFFRIVDSNRAAERVSSFSELRDQLLGVVKGSVRAILASHDLEEIMQGRSKFAEVFTKEVHDQVANWGIETVKNLELMDIKDTDHSQVISNIMAKKKSKIEMESRTEVAGNKKLAEIAEVEAKREVDLQSQQAKQAVGLRTVEADREVQIRQQNASQLIKEQEKLTMQKLMEVQQVEKVRTAEITREVEIVKAEQNKRTVVLSAEAQLENTKRVSEGISLDGTARANAAKAMQLAPVEAQITLAKEIGANQDYQKYLVTLRQVEAAQAVGVEQAKALEKAQIKVIANTGDSVNSGMNSVMDLFSAAGGTKIGAMLEALANTENGKELLAKATAVATKNGAAQKQ